MHAILATWGWIILGIFFLTAMYFGRNKFGVLVVFFALAGTLYYTAGFNSEFFNPKELHLENLLIFLTGVMVGGWGWIILALLLCAIFPLVEYEREGWALGLVIVSAAVLYVVTGWNLFLLILYHPLWVLPAFIAYLAVGVTWARWVKWPRFVDKAIEKMTAAKKEFITQWAELLKIDVVAAEQLRSAKFDSQDRPLQRQQPQRSEGVRWRGINANLSTAELDTLKKAMLDSLEKGIIPDALLEEWFKNDEAKKVSVLRNKERFLNWVMFWPWSALAYFFFDFIKEIVERIWRQMISSLQAVVDSKYQNVDQRLVKNPAYE